jgi:ubiquinone biosynthesis protein
MRDRIIDLMVAAAREDYRGIADALYAIGRPKGRIDRNAYEAEVAVLAGKYLGKQLQDIESSALIRDLVYGATKYDIEIPADFLMFGKALMTVEGIGKEIYPELDLFEEIKPYFVRLMRQRYSPERITQDVTRAVVRLSGAATELPVQLQEILNDLREGSLQIQVHERQAAHATERMGRRIFGGLVLGSLVVASAILAAANQMTIASVVSGIAGAYAFALGGRLFFLQRSQRRQK